MATSGRGRRPDLRDDVAFTLIELLVVIVVIGILAAIALPVFLRQRQQADDADAKTTAKNVAYVLQSYQAEHDSYAASRADVLTAAPELTSSNWTLDTSDSDFTVTVTATGNDTFTISRAVGGPETHSCSPANSGGCRGGDW